MSNLKPFKGLKANLSSVPIQEGQMLICTDTGEIYFDINSTTRILSGGVPVNPIDTTNLTVWIEDK